MSRPALTRDTDQGSVVERLAEEMIDRWHQGERPLAEEYLDRAPSVRDDPEVALELIAEELALREEFGLPVSATELAEVATHEALAVAAWIFQGVLERRLGSLGSRFVGIGVLVLVLAADTTWS